MTAEERFRWNVHTERIDEGPRWGFGEADLDVTLRHLARRGDRVATVYRHSSSGEVGASWRVDLPRYLEKPTNEGGEAS